MPELPEVEVTRQSFADRIAGARVTAVRLGKPLRWPLGCDPDLLVAQTVGGAIRRGKYLWLPLSGGGLLMHLGMSGSLAFSDSLGSHGIHDHFDLTTTQGTLRLTDPRRFGAVVWSPGLEDGMAAKLLAGLGLEPFDARFTGEYLHAALKRRRVAVKLALLAGDIVVGAGTAMRSAARAPNAWPPRCATPWPARWRWAARPFVISATPTAWPASSSPRPGSTAERVSPASPAVPRSAASCRASARRFSALRASVDKPARGQAPGKRNSSQEHG
jgi:hypothetical protein